MRAVLEVARAEQPDLIVHAGDLFDASRPAYEALEVGVQALGRLAEIAPTVVVCGNHERNRRWSNSSESGGPPPRAALPLRMRW